MSNEDVRLKLAAAGWKVADQRVSDFLRNPFYCGLVAHSALEGKVIEGTHEKAVSVELFIQVNGLLAKNHYGYSHRPENDEVPLKKFVRCASCDKPLTGYKAKKNSQYYYKCSTAGCKCNRRASQMHAVFKTLLQPFCLELSEGMRELIEQNTINTFLRCNADKEAAKEELSKQLAEVAKKIDRLEERYILEEIDREMFSKYKEKFTTERQELERQLAKSGNSFSNLQKSIQKALDYAAKLASMWDLGDYGERQEVQYLVFPEGIAYDREKDTYRTGRANSIFSYMAGLAQTLAKKKTGETNPKISFPGLVEAHGFEPRTLCL